MGDFETFLTPTPRPVATRRFVVLTALATALVVITTLVALHLWEEKQPTIDGLGSKVIDSMNESLSKDPRFNKVGAEVTSITVMRAGKNTFEGQASVVTKTGADHEVMVHINYDGDVVLWQTDPGAFLFALQLEGTP